VAKARRQRLKPEIVLWNTRMGPRKIKVWCGKGKGKVKGGNQ
jgi:hypothetical protein